MPNQQNNLADGAEVAPDPGQMATIRVMTEGGMNSISPDSRSGALMRPSIKGQEGARTATLETLFDYFIDNVPDPDFALQNDPNFLERIRQQPDVHAAMRKREVSVASLPLMWKPSAVKGVDPAEANLMCEYITDIWSDIPNIHELYRWMQGAVLAGGTGVEWIWARGSEGVSRPVAYCQLHKSRFVFDRLGNMALLSRDQPVWGSYVAPSTQRIFGDYQAYRCPGGRFMYHKYMAEGGAWQQPAGEGYLYWGRGEDTNLYYIVKFDQWVLRFRLKWLEKHGMPFTVLYYPDGGVSQAQIDGVCRSIRDEAIALVPHPPGTSPQDWFSIDFIAPPPIGHDAFAMFSKEWTAPAVDKILLGGANQMDIGEVGGYSATINQREAGEMILFRYDAMSIDETITGQLVPHIIRSVPRWANVPLGHMPRHCMAPERPKNRMEELQIIQTMAQMVRVREDDVYDAGGHSRPKDGADGAQPERSIFLGNPEAGGDIWSAMPDDEKDVQRSPDTRGLKSIESPRMEQTRQAQLFAMKKQLGNVSARLSEGSGSTSGGGKLQRLNGKARSR
jgi:hypothetical protein